MKKEDIKQKIREALKDLIKEDEDVVDTGLGLMQKWEIRLLMKLGAITKITSDSINYGYAIKSDYPMLKVYRKGEDDYLDCDGDINKLESKAREVKDRFNSVSKIVYMPRMYPLYQRTKEEFFYGKEKAQEYQDDSLQNLIDNADIPLEANAFH